MRMMFGSIGTSSVDWWTGFSCAREQDRETNTYVQRWKQDDGHDAAKALSTTERRKSKGGSRNRSSGSPTPKYEKEGSKAHRTQYAQTAPRLPFMLSMHGPAHSSVVLVEAASERARAHSHDDDVSVRIDLATKQASPVPLTHTITWTPPQAPTLGAALVARFNRSLWGLSEHTLSSLARRERDIELVALQPLNTTAAAATEAAACHGAAVQAHLQAPAAQAWGYAPEPHRHGYVRARRRLSGPGLKLRVVGRMNGGLTRYHYRHHHPPTHARLHARGAGGRRGHRRGAAQAGGLLRRAVRRR